MSYTAYRPTIDAARQKPAIWRLILGVITTFALTVVWLAAMVLVLVIVSPHPPMVTISNVFGGAPFTPGRSILFLLVVAGLGFGTFVAAALWQGRSRRSLIGYGPRALRDFAIAALFTLTLAGGLTLIQLAFETEDTLVRNLDAATWLAWLPLALLAIAFQTGAEELFFRGYLQSQLAARFRSPAIWLVLPSIAFGFAHFAPGLPAANGWLYVGFAAFFGLMAADLTARTGTLGAAWGWHFANNTFALLVIATPGSVTGLGYWTTTSSLLEPIEITPFLAFDIILLVAIWFCLRRLLKV